MNNRTVIGAEAIDIAVLADGRTACMPLHIPDTANRLFRGARAERGSLQHPVSIPPSPRADQRSVAGR